MRNENYEPAPEYDADAYRVKGHPGIAWAVLGHETEPVAVTFCPDCGRTEYEYQHGGGSTGDPGDPECEHEHAHQDDEPDYRRTGQMICVMIGDDRHHTIDPDDLEPITNDDYCPECGQTGCRAYH